MSYFLYSRWTSLSLPDRHKLATLLDIPKTGPTHVQDDRIVADGYPIEAVESALHDTSRLQSLLETKSDDPTVIWDLLVGKITPVEPETVTESNVSEKKPEEVPEKGSLEASNAKPEKIKVIPAEPKPEPKKKTAKKAKK